MIAHSDWTEGDIFSGSVEDGAPVTFDAGSAHDRGPSPMQAVLMALCACTSVDVVSILRKKRQPLARLRVTAEAEQAAEAPRVFTRIRLVYAVGGAGLSRKAVEDAVALSKQKYCSVSLMLEKAAPVEYAIVYPEGEPEA